MVICLKVKIKLLKTKLSRGIRMRWLLGNLRDDLDIALLGRAHIRLTDLQRVHSALDL